MPGVTYERQVQFTSHGPVAVHVLNAPKPGGAYSLKPVLSNGAILGKDRVTTMQRGIRDATAAGVNGDLFTLADGRPERDADAGRRPPAPAARGPLDPGDRRRRRAPRPEAAHVRHLARDRAAAPDGPERGAAPERDLALHLGVGAGDAGRRRRGRGDRLAAARDDPERRPHRPGHRPGAEREHGDPAGRRRPLRPRHRGAAAARRGAGRDDRDDPAAREPGHRRARARRRRRPGPRARRQADLPRQRAVLDRADGAERAHRRGAARRRPRRDGGRRRPPPRLLGRDDELRARADARAPRRRHGDRRSTAVAPRRWPSTARC